MTTSDEWLVYVNDLDEVYMTQDPEDAPPEGFDYHGRIHMQEVDEYILQHCVP